MLLMQLLQSFLQDGRGGGGGEIRETAFRVSGLIRANPKP